MKEKDLKKLLPQGPSTGSVCASDSTEVAWAHHQIILFTLCNSCFNLYIELITGCHVCTLGGSGGGLGNSVQ